MTNSWAMLFDYLYGEDADRIKPEDIPSGSAYDSGFEYILNDVDGLGYRKVVITEDETKPTGKDATFWKYNEGKILREVEAYLSSTYKGHYVGEEGKIQTLDLIDSNGDAEPFCRANIIKYASRFGKKEGKNPKDLLKVIHYAFLLYHFSDLPFKEDATKETFSPMGR